VLYNAPRGGRLSIPTSEAKSVVFARDIRLSGLDFPPVTHDAVEKFASMGSTIAFVRDEH